MKEEYNQKVSLWQNGEEVEEEKVRGKEEMIDDCRRKLRLRKMEFLHTITTVKTPKDGVDLVARLQVSVDPI